MRNRKTALVHDPVFIKSTLCIGLSDLELNAVTAFLEPREIKSGEVIFEEGADGEEMFILIHGEINAWVKQADGTQRRMFGMNAGDFFGEMSLIAKECRSATLIAEKDSELLVLHSAGFYRLVFEFPMIGKKILNAIIMEQNIWLEQSSKHLDDLMRWGEAARRRAIIDELTGLHNRLFLEESAAHHFNKSTAGLRKLSLMMMDLDKIHEVNAKYGSKAGDLVFVSVAGTIRSSTRADDICARLSGDEFAALLPDTEPEEAMKIAEKVRNNIATQGILVPESPGGTKQTKIKIHTSIGIATAPVHAENWGELLLAADHALARSKELGRNRVTLAG